MALAFYISHSFGIYPTITSPIFRCYCVSNVFQCLYNLSFPIPSHAIFSNICKTIKSLNKEQENSNSREPIKLRAHQSYVRAASELEPCVLLAPGPWPLFRTHRCVGSRWMIQATTIHPFKNLQNGRETILLQNGIVETSDERYDLFARLPSEGNTARAHVGCVRGCRRVGRIAIM